MMPDNGFCGGYIEEKSNGTPKYFAGGRGEVTGRRGLGHEETSIATGTKSTLRSFLRDVDSLIVMGAECLF